MRCNYYDCGWCYHPKEDETNAKNGECNFPQSCPYLNNLATSITGTPSDQTE